MNSETYPEPPAPSNQTKISDCALCKYGLSCRRCDGCVRDSVESHPPRLSRTAPVPVAAKNKDTARQVSTLTLRGMWCSVMKSAVPEVAKIP